MKPIPRLLFVFAVGLFAVPALAQSMAGKWTASFDTQIGVQSYEFEFIVDGSTVTGNVSSANGEYDIEEGKIEDGTLSFVENMNYQGMPLRIVYTGQLEGDEIHFTRDVAGLAMEEFVATRPEE